MIWFTSDTHFGHENVLKFTDRPWETIWQMNDAIVDGINGRVAVDEKLEKNNGRSLCCCNGKLYGCSGMGSRGDYRRSSR